MRITMVRLHLLGGHANFGHGWNIEIYSFDEVCQSLCLS